MLDVVVELAEVLVPGHGPVGGEREVRELQAYLRALCRRAGRPGAIGPGPWDEWLDRDRDAINVERAVLSPQGRDELPPTMVRIITGLRVTDIAVGKRPAPGWEQGGGSGAGVAAEAGAAGDHRAGGVEHHERRRAVEAGDPRGDVAVGAVGRERAEDRVDRRAPGGSKRADAAAAGTMPARIIPSWAMIDPDDATSGRPESGRPVPPPPWVPSAVSTMFHAVGLRCAVVPADRPARAVARAVEHRAVRLVDLREEGGDREFVDAVAERLPPRVVGAAVARQGAQHRRVDRAARHHGASVARRDRPRASVRRRHSPAGRLVDPELRERALGPVRVNTSSVTRCAPVASTSTIFSAGYT